MEEFSTRQKMMFASFDLSVEEQAIFDRYYKFLDESGVAEVIKRAIQNDTQKGGWACLFYGFAGCNKHC
ncbi:MAG: hypothetical protein J6252_05845 [Clostridia bacterium]|nr:hypothetical protein [Clostridia bacterium]